MLIRWTGGKNKETRDVPSLGLLAEGDERECTEVQGKNLIKQGLAKEVKKDKKTNSEGGK